MALNGEDLGWGVRVQRLQIVRQHEEAFSQRRRDFHEIQSPINKDRLKVTREAQVPWASASLGYLWPRTARAHAA
jgi:hypothetical protein